MYTHGCLHDIADVFFLFFIFTVMLDSYFCLSVMLQLRKIFVILKRDLSEHVAFIFMFNFEFKTIIAQ